MPQLPDSIIASLNTASATVSAATIAATIALIAAALSLIGVLVSATIAKRNGMITARTAQQVGTPINPGVIRRKVIHCA